MFGATYVLDDRAFDLSSGETVDLPAHAGSVLTRDPELNSVLLYEHTDDTVTFHQAWLDGRHAETLLALTRVGWLFESAHALPGTAERQDNWLPEHLAWDCSTTSNCAWSLL